jgi:hypothetical protein
MVRRVVTAHDRSGRSIVASDEELTPRGEDALSVIWGYDCGPVRLPSDGALPSFASHFPPPAGIRVYGVEFEPGEVKLTVETLQRLPAELRESFERAGSEPESGFHVSDTVDVAIVVSGEIDLELDDGARVTLEAGDCVVQNGTTHAWRPSPTRGCEIVFVLIGAVQAGSPSEPAS